MATATAPAPATSEQERSSRRDGRGQSAVLRYVPLVLAVVIIAR